MMKINLETIRRFVINCLSVSMITIIWIFVIDFLLYNQRKPFFVMLSVILFSVLECLMQYIFKSISEKYPILTWVLQYIVVIMIFAAFKELFHWYEGFSIILMLTYTLPVFVISYLLILIGISKDVRYINQKLQERLKNNNKK